MAGDQSLYWMLVSFVYGAAIGSFLNVVILRLPMEQSIVSPPSRCPQCGSPIRFYDNIPIVSYLALRGRCRDCATRISPRYLLVELVTGALFCGLYVRIGYSPALLVFSVFCAAMVVVFWIDLDHMIIPDEISLNGLPIGLGASILGLIPGMDWKSSLIGMVLGGAVLYVPAVLYEMIRGTEGLGGGDVKLLAMIGTFTGPVGVVFVLFFSSVTGAAIGISGMVLRGVDSTTPIPYGPFIAVGAVTYVMAGPVIIEFFARLSGML